MNVSPLDTSDIFTALLCFWLFFSNGRSFGDFSFSSVGTGKSERMSFARVDGEI